MCISENYVNCKPQITVFWSILSITHMLLSFLNSNESAIKISIMLKYIKYSCFRENHSCFCLLSCYLNFQLLNRFQWYHVAPISSCWNDFTDMQTLFSSQNFNYDKHTQHNCKGHFFGVMIKPLCTS